MNGIQTEPDIQNEEGEKCKLDHRHHTKKKADECNKRKGKKICKDGLYHKYMYIFSPAKCNTGKNQWFACKRNCHHETEEKADKCDKKTDEKTCKEGFLHRKAWKARQCNAKSEIAIKYENPTEDLNANKAANHSANADDKNKKKAKKAGKATKSTNPTEGEKTTKGKKAKKANHSVVSRTPRCRMNHPHRSEAEAADCDRQTGAGTSTFTWTSGPNRISIHQDHVTGERKEYMQTYTPPNNPSNNPAITYPEKKETPL